MNLPEAAAAYAERGIAVFPLQPRENAPLAGHGFRYAQRDPATVAAWWRERATCNICFLTGETNGFRAFDTDGADDETYLAAP